MWRILLISCLLLSVVGSVSAQTEEPIRCAITGPSGQSLTLDGTLSLPAGTKGRIPVVLILAGSGPTDRNGNNPIPPGFPNSVKADSYKQLADSLARLGVSVARFDKRGVGRSLASALTEQQLRFETYIQDAVSWIKLLQADKRFSGVTVLGHSEGSLIGMVAARQTRASGFVSVAGAGRNIADILKAQLGPQLPEASKREVFTALDSLRAGHTLGRMPNFPGAMQLFRPSVQPYLISWMAYDPAREIKLLTLPVLIIQGKRDSQVTMVDAERLKSGSPSATLLVFNAMTHTLKDAATDSPADILKTYTDPGQPLTPGLATAIAEFVK